MFKMKFSHTQKKCGFVLNKGNTIIDDLDKNNTCGRITIYDIVFTNKNQNVAYTEIIAINLCQFCNSSFKGLCIAINLILSQNLTDLRHEGLCRACHIESTL